MYFEFVGIWKLTKRKGNNVHFVAFFSQDEYEEDNVGYRLGEVSTARSYGLFWLKDRPIATDTPGKISIDRCRIALQSMQ